MKGKVVVVLLSTTLSRLTMANFRVDREEGTREHRRELCAVDVQQGKESPANAGQASQVELLAQS